MGWIKGESLGSKFFHSVPVTISELPEAISNILLLVTGDYHQAEREGLADLFWLVIAANNLARARWDDLTEEQSDDYLNGARDCITWALEAMKENAAKKGTFELNNL